MMKDRKHSDAVGLDSEVGGVWKPSHHRATNSTLDFREVHRRAFDDRERLAHYSCELHPEPGTPTLVPLHRLLNLSGRLRFDDQWDGQP